MFSAPSGHSEMALFVYFLYYKHWGGGGQKRRKKCLRIIWMVPKVPIATENWLFWPQIQPQNVAVARAYISDLFQRKCRRIIAQFEGGWTGKKGNIILPIYLCNNKHLGCVSDRLCLGNIMLSNKDRMKRTCAGYILMSKTFWYPNVTLVI